MIVRTYGRRSRGSAGSYSDDIVSDSPSQECSQDVYTFTLSSDESGRRHFSDTHSSTLPSRKGGDCGDYDVGLPKRKKVKVKKINSSMRKCSSSQALEKSVFDFSESTDFGSYGLNSSQKFQDLWSFGPRKCKAKWGVSKSDAGCGKSKKKLRKENRGLENKKNNTSKNLSKKEAILRDAVLTTTTLMETQDFWVDFKKRIGEFERLDAVFEVARNCHCIIEEWSEKSPNFAVDLKDNAGFESLLMLLKCLKVMENATSLSQDNQYRLLGMKGQIDGRGAPLSFTKLILSVIKNLSGVSLLRSSLSNQCLISCHTSSDDPFAFHGDEFGTSKWDLLSQADVAATVKEDKDEEKSKLLDDCLLTAVKVLMNLTNDNSEGCQQIGKFGGLEILSSLIGRHFPSFSLLTKFSHRIDQPSNKHLTDQELDFLVAILGLLVNLVEKDGHNRSQLAATHVSLPGINGLEDQRDVISLLCSIFLANQGDAKYLSLDNEGSTLRGEKEAEKMIIEAYAALLLAFLSMESKSTRNAIAECFPVRNLTILVPVLERFAVFHVAMNMISPETHDALLEVIESCRIP